MKKQVSGQREDTDIENNDEMKAEYDLAQMAGGVRGKYYQTYREGHAVEIHKSDGTTIVQHFKLEEGAVMLEPDVRAYFPDSEAVNQALRSLIALIPAKPRRRVSARL
jgi:hypothetical protein